MVRSLFLYRKYGHKKKIGRTMKNSILTDILFTILSAAVLVGLSFLVGSDTIGRFSLIVILAGYFIGKLVGQRQKQNGNTEC